MSVSPSKVVNVKTEKQERVSDVARLIKKSKNVFVMLGAGVSTSAGIPDFRSPGTGLYANLARLNLPYPEAVFEINFFRDNPVPFYMLAAELNPGRFRPTITHSFVRLMSDQSALNTCFTQNIDTLERRAGIPSDKIIEAHGSFASHKCIDCNEPYDDELMQEMIKKRRIPRCEMCTEGLVKPNIVFFGEALPQEFIKNVPKLREADLLIVMGTSLTVHPFASLVELVPQECPRVLINGEVVGSFGRREGDIICLGRCDDIIKELAEELGWAEKLQKTWDETKNTVEPIDRQEEEKLKKSAEEERLAQEVEKITRDLGEALVLEKVTTRVQEKQEEAQDTPSTLLAESLKPAENKKDDDGERKKSDEVGEVIKPASGDTLQLPSKGTDPV